MRTEAGRALPPQAAEKLKEQMRGVAGATTLQIKGNRARSSGMGVTSITDLQRGSIQLLDQAKKRFARASQKQFLEAMTAHLAPHTTGGEQPKIDTTTSKTGRSQRIANIRAEETEIVLTLSFPGAPVETRTTISVWTPAAGEADRHPGLQELDSYVEHAWTGPDITGSMRVLAGRSAHTGTGLTKLIQAMKDVGLILEMTATTSMTGLSEAIRSLKSEDRERADSRAGEDVMFVMTQTLQELSTGSLPDSLFAVPQACKLVSLKEMIGPLLPKAH